MRSYSFDIATRKLDEMGAPPVVLVVCSESRALVLSLDKIPSPYEVISSAPGESDLLDLVSTRDIAVALYDASICNTPWYPLLVERCAGGMTRLIMVEGATPSDDAEASPSWHWRVSLDRPAEIAHVVAMAFDDYKTRLAYMRARSFLDAILESSSNSINLKDINGTYLICNERAARHLGLTHPADVIGRTVRDICPLDEVEHIEKADRELIARDVPSIEMIIERVRPYGVRRSYLVRKQPVRGSDGTIMGILSNGQDITELLNTEREIKAREKLMDMVLDSMDQGLVVTDKNDRISIFNKRFVEILGVPVGEVRVGRPMVDLIRALHCHGLVSERSADQTIDARLDYLNSPRPRTVERTRDGKVLEVRDNPMPDGGTVEILTDMTTQREAERRLQHAQKMDAIGQLTGGIAHDFNNLLTVITANLGLLAMRFRDDVDASKWLGTALRASERGSRLTRRLLSFARQQHLQPKKLSLNDLIEDSVEMLKRTLGEDIDIRQELDPHLPLAVIDPSEFQSALINLAVNSRDAMPSGGCLTIETEAVAFTDDVRMPHLEIKRGEYVSLAISDTGCGIAQHDLDRVFEPFFTTKEVGKGTGLGLSMVYGFVNQSGGYLSVYSEVGVGTTVRLYFPAKGRALEARQGAQAAAPEILLGGGKILVVEDNEDVLESVTAMLQSLNCEVIAASAGSEALSILSQRDDVDVLFTDVVMPGGMNGFELAERARAMRPDLSVLYTSGYAQKALNAGGRMLPGAELLHKPYERQQLAAKIRKLLTKGEAQCTTFELAS